MRNKRLLRTLSALCLTLVLASGFTVPAFAQGAAPPPAEDTTNDSNVVVEETEKAPPLTPEATPLWWMISGAINSSLPLPPRRATIFIS
mgnify:CR=1 FL=1